MFSSQAELLIAMEFLMVFQIVKAKLQSTERSSKVTNFEPQIWPYYTRFETITLVACWV